MKIHWILVIALAVVVVVLGVLLVGQREGVDVAAEEAAIRQATDVEWLDAGKAKDLERWVSFHTDDALLLTSGGPIVTGKEAIRDFVSELISAPGWAATWETTRVEVSRSGDLAYSYGTEEATVNDAEGNPVTDHLKWVAGWKKQADGSWKCAVLIWNSDQPPPTAPTS